MSFYIPTLFREQLGAARRVSVFSEETQALPPIFYGGTNYKHEISCYVKAPDGTTVMENISGITVFKDIDTERDEINRLKDALREEIRKKYPIKA
ncbi:MAG TPA: hypothetical protein VI968_01490 [archaeon]|nr:hypothetical protein [archaeon]